MNIWQAALLGIVQGLAEMLPISSSAHLVLTPWLFGFEDPGLAFDVALHVGTLVAIVAYFWREWLDIGYSMIRLVRERRISSQSQKLAGLLVVASIPGAIFGYLLNDYAESFFRNPLLVSLMLVLMGSLLLFADRRDKGEKDFSKIGVKDALKIGLAQALAIIPGVSRSGATMTTGLLLGIDRESAARFSFMMSAPIIAGAAMVKVGEISLGMFQSPVFWIGMLTAVLSSFFAIGFLLRFIKKHSFSIFVYYRFVLALVIVLFYLGRNYV